MLSGTIISANLPLNVYAEALSKSERELTPLTDNSNLEKSTTITIKDSNLETIIRQSLNKTSGDLTISDMESLIYLDASNSNISDLTGLEYAINLNDLNLTGNQIQSITPLKNLTRLQTLMLSENEVQDISALSNLTALTTLYLTQNHVSNINALRNLHQLSNLQLSNNQISDASPLSGLTNLRTLNLNNNHVTDFSSLPSTITSLNISYQNPQINVLLNEDKTWANPFINVDGSYMDFVMLPSRVQLSPDKSTLTFTSASHGDIYNLQVRGNNVTIDAMVKLQDPAFMEYVSFNDANLEAAIRNELNIPTNAITTEDMKQLVELDLENLSISDLTGLDKAINLVTLNLSNNNLSDISPLESLTKLENLYLNQNEINNITFLSQLTSLSTLDLSNNEIENISALETLTGLNYLNLNNNNIHQIEPLSNLSQLTNLYLQNNQVADASPLVTLPQLNVLHIGQNELTTPEHLSQLTQLSELLAQENHIGDFSPLNNLTQLSTKDFSNQSIEIEVSLIDGKTNNPFIDVDGNFLPLVTLPNDVYPSQDNSEIIFNQPILSHRYSISAQNPYSTASVNATLVVQDILRTEGVISITETQSQAGEKKFRVEITEGLYGVEKIILPDGTEVFDSEASFTVTNSGEYTVKYVDSQGNEFSNTILVEITQPSTPINHAPVLTANDVTIEIGNNFIPLDHVSATDVEDDDDSLVITIVDENVNTQEAGTYYVTYSVTDSQGATATKTITVTVNPIPSAPNQAPAITANDVSITVGDSFNPLDHISVTDDEDDDSSLVIDVIYDDVKTDKEGVYHVVYSVTDSQGATTTKTITVTVNPAPNKAPVIIANDVSLQVGDTFNPLDYVLATDEEDGDADIKVIKNTVDTQKPGTYEVVYQATDSQGLSINKTITVTVIPSVTVENSAPIILASNLNIRVNYPIDLLAHATAYDKEDGPLPIKIISSNLDNTKAGTYEVTYEAADSQGLKATTTITITVREQSKEEMYTKDIKLPSGDDFDLDEILDSFAKETGLSNVEVIDGEVDPSTAGDYELTVQGDNKQQEKEIHELLITIEDETASNPSIDESQNETTIDDKEENETTADNKEENSNKHEEIIETGITGGSLFLGGILSGIGLIVKRKRD